MHGTRNGQSSPSIVVTTGVASATRSSISVEEEVEYSTSSCPIFSRFTVCDPVTTGKRLPGFVNSRNAASYEALMIATGISFEGIASPQ